MTLRVALAQVNTHVGDIAGNVERVLASWRAAGAMGADVVAFPELAVTGYPPEDLLLKPEFVAANVDAMERLARQAPPEVLGVVGYVGRGPGARRPSEWDVAGSPGDLRNSAAVILAGEQVATYHKGRLPNYGVFDEARYFAPGDDRVVVEVAGARVAVTICEDLWTDGGPVRAAARAGADLVLNINASPYHRGKRAERERWVRHHATDASVWVAYVNAFGGQDELVFDGDSMVCAPDGTMVARGAQFAGDLVVVDLPVGGRGTDRPPLAARDEPGRLDPVAEVWEALVLATRDYCHKNGFQRAVIAVSGGIDSALTAAIAAEALGPSNVLAVCMPSRFTSDRSLEDAKALAENLGIAFDVVAIESVVDAFEGTLDPLFAGRPRDATEENLQARVRGTILMAISNKLGHLVLATGNKSENAVGYATLYGDMVGGFAVLKDCTKGLVYDLARHCNARGPCVPESTMTREPTAELAPGQRDTDSLPPYEELDPILVAYVEHDLGIDEIVAQGHEERLVRRVVAMVDRAEHKRRQAPPGPKVTARAFGRDRRVPITNGWKG